MTEQPAIPTGGDSAAEWRDEGDGEPAPPAAGVRYRAGIDTGGTFVDAVVTGSDGSVASAKGLAGGESAVTGVLRKCAAQLGCDVATMLARTSAIVYGTTAALNALLTRRGDPTGLLTTRGHEDALLIGRVHQKVAGLSPQAMTDVAHLTKPPPIVPRRLVAGIHERIDSAGRELVPLDRAGVVKGVARLVDGGCRSIAVCFLWSFRNDAHEREARSVIAERFAGLPVVLSSEVAPVLGEYERGAATVVSAFVRSAVEGHVSSTEGELRRLGFSGDLYIMRSSGGFATVAEAVASPAGTLGSGPAGGLMAAARWAGATSLDVISADVGGTSFDVGLVVDGIPELEDTPVIDKLHLATPALKIDSIGAGGGSIAWVDDIGGLHVGPESAGANPGPACFGRGGTRPTVTDADLLLGRIRPEAGDLTLDPAAAEDAVGRLARRLGAGVAETAAGIVRVADAQMADLIRKATLERGRDPRRFTLVAFGGAGPVHVGEFAPDVGVAAAVVPPLAPVLSAHGLAASTWRKVYAASHIARLPAAADTVPAAVDALEEGARRDFATVGMAGTPVLERTIDMRYGRQTHVVRVGLPAGMLGDAAVTEAIEAFEAEYERLFGVGTGYREAGVECVSVGLVARAEDASPAPQGLAPAPAPPPAPGTRRVFFDGWIDTPVYSFHSLSPSFDVAGPAVIDGPGTTLVVHPGQRAAADDTGTVWLTWGGR